LSSSASIFWNNSSSSRSGAYLCVACVALRSVVRARARALAQRLLEHVHELLLVEAAVGRDLEEAPLSNSAVRIDEPLQRSQRDQALTYGRSAALGRGRGRKHNSSGARKHAH
jgi:hypothetical protein